MTVTIYKIWRELLADVEKFCEYYKKIVYGLIGHSEPAHH